LKFKKTFLSGLMQSKQGLFGKCGVQCQAKKISSD
jgi:hypothetical protein